MLQARHGMPPPPHPHACSPAGRAGNRNRQGGKIAATIETSGQTGDTRLHHRIGKGMVRLARIWGDLRRRFALLFMIGLALSVASLLEHIQFLLDAWYALVKFAGGIGGLADILKGCAALVSWCVEWWRSLVRPVFQWISYLLPWQIPPWVQDVTSVVFFSLGRGYSELKFRLIELLQGTGHGSGMGNRGPYSQH